MLDAALLLVVLGGGAVAIRYLATRANDPALDEAWRAAARRVGGEVEIVPARFLQTGRRQIRLVAEDVPMHVRTEEVGSGSSKNIVTRLSAGPLPTAVGSRIRCEKRSLLSKMARELGMDPILTGHADFDNEIHLSGAPEALLFTFLDRATRATILTSDSGFELDEELLMITCEGEPTDAEPLVRLIRFGEKIVRRWCDLVRGPIRLAQHLHLEAKSLTHLGLAAETVAEGQFRGRPIALLVRATESFVLTILRLDDATHAEWTMERGGDTGAFVETGTPPEVARAFGRVAPRALLGLRTTNGQLELAFDGLVPERDDVVAALEADVAFAPTQPYR